MADFGRIGKYYIYYTSLCLNESHESEFKDNCHVHVNVRKVERGAAKFFVRKSGVVELMKQGCLHSRDVGVVLKYIEANAGRIYAQWKKDTKNLLRH